MKTAGTTPLRRALQRDNDVFFPVLIGAIVYLAAIAAATMFILSAQAEHHEATDRLIVQLPSLNDTAANLQRLEGILPKLQALPGIAKIDLICPRHLASPVLEHVVDSLSIADAPPLTVVAAELRAEGGDVVAVLRHRLMAELPDSKITSESEFAEVARRSVYPIQGLMVLILGLLAATLCVSVGFTMGAHLSPTSERVSLLHSLGADDVTLIRVIVENTTRSALLGGASGAGLAMLTFLTFAGVAGGDFVGAATEVLQSWATWALIIALPMATVMLVALSAWFFARRAFATMP